MKTGRHGGCERIDEAKATSVQARALAHVRALARGGPLDHSLRVTLHFHPDRLMDGKPILEAIADDGIYRSQFETGTSNGGLTAHPGGDRWHWESRLFAGAYDDSAAQERPKYGSLNFRRRRVGGSPRFGSAHLRLAERTLAHATFCYPDSVLQPNNFGVAEQASSLLTLAGADHVDQLDDYIEAHVHGLLQVPGDVEAIVLDPCYRETTVESAAAALGCVVEWHPGFRLSVSELKRHADYRGPEYVDLGLSLAEEGYLDSRMIGDASRSGRYDEQALKRVWHCLARFGTPEFAT